MNIMANDNFKKALYDALIPEFSDMLPHADENEYVFSHKFESNMQKLIKRRNKPYYKIINTVGKRIACIAVIILVASSVTIFSVEAFRNAVADFFVNIYEKFSTIQSSDETGVSPLTIENLYDITWDLDGYEVVYEERTDYNFFKTYVNKDIVINYAQYTKAKFNIDTNTENAEISSINIGQYDAIYFYDNHNYHHLIWDKGDYVIEIMSNIDKNTLIDIANSVKKVE